MKLYLIYREGTNKRTLKLYHEAAEELDVEIVEVVSNDFDFSEYEMVAEQDAVLCLSDDRTSNLVEKCLLSPNTKSFYKDYKTAMAKIDDADDITSYLVHKVNGLPVINSIVGITADKQRLHKYVEKLGGFPIVLKALGRQKGHGTMLVDSSESLNSIDDFLVRLNERIILKRFIQEAKSLRAVVIGDKAVAAIEHQALPGDFRSNSGKGDHHSRSYELNKKEAETAVAAVTTLGYEFGGVDLSVDAQGNVFITEVNMPCSIVRTQELTQVPIPKLMVEHLLAKPTIQSA